MTAGKKEASQRELAAEVAAMHRDAVILSKCFGESEEGCNEEQKLARARLRRMTGFDNPCFVFKSGQPTDPYKAAYLDGCRYMFTYIMAFISENIHKPTTEE